MFASRLTTFCAVAVGLGTWAVAAEGEDALDLKTCLAQLKAKYSGTRRQAVSCLSQYVKDDPHARYAVMRAMHDPDVEVREAAASGLGGAGKEAIPELVRALGDEGSVVQSAVKSLGQIGPDAIPAVSTALFEQRQLAAAWALAEIGSPALPELIKGLEDPRVNGLAAAGIENMGPAGAPAVPALARMLSDSRPAMRLIALQAITAVGHDAAAAVPALIKALDDRDQDVRVMAASTLGAVGPPAAPAVPKLRAMAQDPSLHRQLRSNCEFAVKKIQGRK